VVLALEASPINQYDLLMIAGGYGYRPRLPAIMGTQGVITLDETRGAKGKLALELG